MRSEVLAGSLPIRRLAVNCWVCVALLLGTGVALDTTANHSSPGNKSDSPSVLSPARAEQFHSEALLLIKKGGLENLSKAIRLLRGGAAWLRAAGLNSAAAPYYLSMGEVYFTWSQYKRAMRNYRLALALSNKSDTHLRCSLLSHISVLYSTSGEIKQSRGYAHKAIMMAHQSGRPEDRAEAYLASGLSNFYSNDIQEALNSFQQASAISQATGNIEAQATASLYQGWALGQLGHTQEAMIEQNKAVRLWSVGANSRGLAQAHAALGLLWSVLGEPDKALVDYEEARSIFHGLGDQDSEAVVLNGFGRVSKELGNYEDSVRYFTKARQIFARVGDAFGEIAAIDGAAGAHWLLRHYEIAKSLYRIKLSRARAAADYWDYADALANLADVYVLERHFHRAQTLYSQALALCRSGAYIWGQIDTLISLAGLYSQTGRSQDAEHSFQEAFKLTESSGEVARQARAHYELARLYDSQHQVDQAKTESEKTIQIIESQRTKVSAYDSRATYFASVHDYYQLYINVLMELDNEYSGQGFAQRAFEAAERSKVRSLLDMLASSQTNSNCNNPAEPLKTTAGETEVSVTDAPCRPAPSALGLFEVQNEMLGDHAVLLEYALGEQASYLWAVDQDHIAAYPLPGSAEILRIADRYRSALMARQPVAGETAEHYADRVMRADHEIGAISQELAKLILAPASDYLRGKKRVIVVPEGPLQYIPFAALPFTDNQPLAANYDVVTLPSFSILKALRDAGANRPSPSQVAAVFADPVFNKDDERVAQSLATTRHPASIMLATALRDVQFGSNNIPRLRGSRKEAEDVVNAFSGQHVFEALDFEASRDTVLSSDLRQYRYLHFATHGVLDTAHPEFSGLILSLVNSKGEPEDGYLRLQDIYNLKLSADLVVLSSCNSALGKDLQSEGIIGLPRAFLYAGAERVISTLWKVDDQATAAFMQHFYSHIRAQENPASALRLAQSDMADDPRWHNPYYWAGFILQGEYR
jgi:CHAT domain-containing protein